MKKVKNFAIVGVAICLILGASFLSGCGSNAENKAITVTFNSTGGLLWTGDEVLQRELLQNGRVINPPNPVKFRNFFIGWFTHPTEGQQFNFNHNGQSENYVIEDMTLYARWRADTRVLLTRDGNFDLFFGTAVDHSLGLGHLANAGIDGSTMPPVESDIDSQHWLLAPVDTVIELTFWVHSQNFTETLTIIKNGEELWSGTPLVRRIVWYNGIEQGGGVAWVEYPNPTLTFTLTEDTHLEFFLTSADL